MFRRAPSDAEWQEAFAAHGEAVDGYVAMAAAIPGGRWLEPLAPGKWSPAEVTEHVRLVYERLAVELTGGPGVAIRMPWLLRPYVRARYLRAILRDGTFPEGARSPREARPVHAVADPAEAGRRLFAEAGDFERELSARRNLAAIHVTHHIFGRLSPWTGLRLCTVHTLHHCRQLRAVEVA